MWQQQYISPCPSFPGEPSLLLPKIHAQGSLKVQGKMGQGLQALGPQLRQAPVSGMSAGLSVPGGREGWGRVSPGPEGPVQSLRDVPGKGPRPGP